MNKNFGNKPKKVVLAVDALNFNPELAARVERGLRSFFGPNLPIVRPVFVLTPNATLTPWAWFDDVALDIAERAREKLGEVLDLGNFTRSSPQILIQKQGRSSDIARSLDAYASTNEAELIVIPPSRKRHLGRLILGSVSDEMLRVSGLPLLTVAPIHETRSSGRRRCLLSHHFVSESAASFVDYFLPIAKMQNMEIVFVHTGPYSENVSVRLRKLVRRAEAAGCRASFRLRWSSPSSPGTLLHIAAQEKIDVIAMPSDIAASPLGTACTMTRTFFRASPYPIWIYRADKPANFDLLSRGDNHASYAHAHSGLGRDIDDGSRSNASL